MAIRQSHSRGETIFANTLIRHAEEAVRFHGDMSGKAALREAFLRDWIAIKLHEEGGYGINLEAREDEFRWLLKGREQHAYDALDLQQRHFLDMVVSLDGDIHAIVELKMGLVYIERDVKRTVKLQSIFRPPIFGYQLVCIIRGTDDIDDQVGILQRIVRKLDDVCRPLQRGPTFEAGDEKGYCCICVIPTAPEAKPSD